MKRLLAAACVVVGSVCYGAEEEETPENIWYEFTPDRADQISTSGRSSYTYYKHDDPIRVFGARLLMPGQYGGASIILNKDISSMGCSGGNIAVIGTHALMEMIPRAWEKRIPVKVTVAKRSESNDCRLHSIMVERPPK